MFKSNLLVILLGTLTYGCITSDSEVPNFETMREKQTLTDNRSGVDGLGGARVAELTPDGRQLLVVSADDNSLSTFNTHPNFELSFSQIFVNDSNISGLNGATSLALSSDGHRAYIVSFYDSAVAIFERDEQENYQFIRSIRDGLPYEDVFSDKESVRAKDTLGLLGAYDIAIAPDNSQIFVASVASNAVSVFDTNGSNNIVSKQVIRDSDNIEYGLGGAVNIVVTPDGSQVIVAGFNEDSITIFNRTANGLLEHSQTLVNGKHQVEKLEAPQGLAVSPDGRYLYVACSGSDAILVFARNEQEQDKYSFIQSMSNSDEDVNGLGGASYVTTSPDGMRVFVASETDKAVVTLTKLKDGTLKTLSIMKSEGIKKVGERNGAASVYASPDGGHLLVTTGKGDTLIVYELH
jgi:DNA-binding beta-propeller fold protein YncE